MDINKLAKVQDMQLADKFALSAQNLVKMLGNCELIPANPGETLKQYKVTGTRSIVEYVEGKEVPVTTFENKVVATHEAVLKPYRIQTTLQEVQKRGYENAVTAKDNKLVAEMQGDIKAGLIAGLETGTGTASGTDMIKAALNAFAKLQNAMEDYGDFTPVFFCNPVDFAAAIGEKEVITAFGLQYVEGFAGLGNLIGTAKVTEGNLYCTASENMKVYYINASNGAELGFGFTSDETGIVAIAHSAELKNLCYDTVAWTAIKVFPEYVDFVVKATIAQG